MNVRALSPAMDRRHVADVIAGSKQPEIMRLRDLEVAVTSGTTSAARITYWRQAMRLTGLWFQPASPAWSFANWAAFSVAIVDGAALGLVGDGQAPAAVAGLALHGRARRWFPLGIDVKSGDRWAWTFTNAAGVDLTPLVLVRWEVPHA